MRMLTGYELYGSLLINAYIGRCHQSCHCKHGGNAEGHPGRRRLAIQPERHPADNDDQNTRQEYIQHVESALSHE